MSQEQHPSYGSWIALWSRCNLPSNNSYPRYGGRGIQCLWPNFKAFITDMGFKPYPELTVERIDNDGHYCADNCKWATMAEQVLNQSRNGLPKGQPLGFHNSDNPNRYIHKQASGTYAVIMHMVRCGPKTRIGTYPTLEEAQAVRDICEYERNVYVNLGLVHNNN